MLEQRYRWKNMQLREHIDILDGVRSPHILLTNATYLNYTLRKWIKANIWIYNDRIIYVGPKKPENITDCEVVDCTPYHLVPGYIEPHVHPFHLYNPQTFSHYASLTGTTTLINDNMMLFLHLEKKKAFSLLRRFNELPVSMYWWCRFDPQTEIPNEETIFSHSHIKSWLEHEAVIQGGELAGWPKLLDGDDLMLHWMQETKRMRKKIEGHFPGASEKTLAKMMLLGADSDHESMTGQEVLTRLLQGYHVSLRFSSIRPDLPNILDELHALGIDHYDHMTLNTDGSPPSFYEAGMMDRLIRICLEHGVPTIDAYNMATNNIARYHGIQHLHGNINTGRVANINFLKDPLDPTPVSVLAKGQWVVKEGQVVKQEEKMKWSEFGLQPLQLEWELTQDDFQFSMPFGVEMVNDVITKPYSISMDTASDELSFEHDECFFMLLDRKGKWRNNTLIKGFADKLCGFASSYSNTGDIVVIGKKQEDMKLAFNELKKMGGGMVLTENGKVLHRISLELQGIMSSKPMETLIEEEKSLLQLLKERGYHFTDPVYSLLFFSSTHLPYIRITPTGMYDVMNKTILFPSMMR